MDYNLETLGDERFQKLCQAILVATFPNVQCLPVGQPDGGRDALLRHDGGFIAYQVKFSKNPQAKTERESIAALIKSEKEKVSRLIEQGATAYYLLTNVCGTSHLNVGSIDGVNEALAEAFGIPCYCWWRDDLERRIEAASGLIWRYPEIARGSDFLEVLAHRHGSIIGSQRAGVFRAYIAAQYEKESEVRFQQVQIQNSLFDLFTDTPIGESREKQPSPSSTGIPEPQLRRLQGSWERSRFGYAERARTVRAAEWLLAAAPNAGVQRIVLEGAPGQGKSTVTQFMCQIHRMKVLRVESGTSQIAPKYFEFSLRLPMRVDLRDYAVWLIGKDPNAIEKDAQRPSGSSDSFESFLAHQIFHLSGGQLFTSEDVSSVLKGNHTILVLDGFDEVADTSTRGRLIEQIRLVAGRLGTLCESVQIIVTSRPAAFILSPGFPEREWSHYRLLPMEPQQISEYSDKWMRAKRLEPRDQHDFKHLVEDRVSRPHIRILAQNPMQLAILLWLISTKGRSLPDKRTALYDSYMDLFFGREAEKDAVVRDNRDIIVQIHQYVAWTLQSAAEADRAAGSLPEDELKALVRSFLVQKEHPTDEVLKLFSGVVERVGALVSRVQGTVEFEVQPLREYFAGKYLYETAPYSPPGKECGGTKPDRFDALARRPYWSNVTRFYAGCYSSGELSSLVAGIEAIHEDPKFRDTTHALQVAVWLLNDWVFAQEPRAVKSIIRFISQDRNLRLLISSRSSWEDARLSFPDKCGRGDFAMRLTQTFMASEDKDYLWRLGLVLRLNTSLHERWQLWGELAKGAPLGHWRAMCLGLFEEANEEQARVLIDTYGKASLRSLATQGKWDVLDETHIKAVFESALDDVCEEMVGVYGGSARGVAPVEVDVFIALLLLNPQTTSHSYYDPSGDITLRTSLMRHGRIVEGTASGGTPLSVQLGIHDFVQTASRVSNVPLRAWQSQLAPWTELVESARQTWGDRHRLFVLAAVAAGIRSKTERAEAFGDLLNPNAPLVERARHARLRGTPAWWELNLRNAVAPLDLHWVLLLALCWAPAGVITLLGPRMSSIIDGLGDSDWRRLLASVESVVWATGSQRAPLKLDAKDLNKVTSVRMLVALFHRLPRPLSRQVWRDIVRRGCQDDEAVIPRLVRIGLSEAARDHKVWRELLPFLQRTPSVGVIGHQDPIFLSVYNSGRPMSSPVAEEVMKHMERMPIQLLDQAEQVLLSQATHHPPPLKQVVDSQHWFDN